MATLLQPLEKCNRAQASLTTCVLHTFYLVVTLLLQPFKTFSKAHPNLSALILTVAFVGTLWAIPIMTVHLLER